MLVEAIAHTTFAWTEHNSQSQDTDELVQMGHYSFNLAAIQFRSWIGGYNP